MGVEFYDCGKVKGYIADNKGTKYASYSKGLLEYVNSLEIKLNMVMRRYRTAKNELCLKCGKYKEEYRGACDGCMFYSEKGTKENE